MKAATQRIQGIWRGTPAGKAGAPFILDGDEETFKHMYHVMAQEPREYRQVHRYPGDWHLLLHMAKAMLRRYWGAGVEFVAKELGTDGSKSGEGSNYRRAHHHITAFGRRLWLCFLLHDYPAYIAFRTALRTGNFRLRLEGLRRIAPIFFITGKDKYQFLVVDHLMEVSRYSRNDMRVEVSDRLYNTLTKRILSSMIEKLAPIAQLREVAVFDFESHLIEKPRTERDRCRELAVKRAPAVRAAMDCLRESPAFKGDDGKDKVVALDGRVFPPVKWQEILDAAAKARAKMRECVLLTRPWEAERQEVSDRLYNTLTKRILSSMIEKLAPIAQLREVAVFDFESHLIEKPRTERDRCRELAVKRAPAVRAAMDCLRESPAFKGDDGKDKVVALDGRVFPPVKWQEILDAAAKARAKMRECVLTNKATKSQGRSSAMKDSVGNAYAGSQEWKALTLNMTDAARRWGCGAKHANKASGPGKWVREHCADGFADDPFYEADAHGVDLPVSIHQGVHPEYLKKGTAGIIDYFKKQLLSKWLQSTELLVVCYDRQDLVPVIKDTSSSGEPRNLYGPWLRADGKAARDEIAAHLATRVLADDVWTGDTKPNGIVAFYGVGGEPNLSVDHPPGVDAEGIGLEVGREGAGQALSETEPLLHFRDGTDTIEGVERQRGPDIGEAKLSVIHFIVWAKKYWGEIFDEWVVSSEDTDLWMIILLAMTTGWLTPRGERAVDVTVLRVVGGETKFLWMNRVFASICELQDGSKSAWPPLTFGSWIPTDDDKVRRHVGRGCRRIRYAILQPPKKKTTATCPSYFSLRKQAERSNAIFRYWQNGLREAMPATEFAGKGWSVDPQGKRNDGVELTVKNCVLDLSEFSYIGPDRKTITLACGCNPETTLCNRCRWKDRKCSLACGCRGRCTLTGSIEGAARPQPPIETRPWLSESVANAMALFMASMKQQESHEAEQHGVDAGTPESPTSNDISSGEAAESKNAEELEDPETDENGDGSVGALDDLIKLDSDESGSSDGESDRLSGKSDDLGWSDGDTDDGVADLVTDAWN
ncbi:unnamed protein product [Ectocarpus sp. CCAP 1310/34]|nr:unnamed protein product [Ectocarpus sp. CCAP 1310/34]